MVEDSSNSRDEHTEKGRWAWDIAFSLYPLYLGHSQKMPCTMEEVLLPSGNKYFLELLSETHPVVCLLVNTRCYQVDNQD